MSRWLRLERLSPRTAAGWALLALSLAVIAAAAWQGWVQIHALRQWRAAGDDLRRHQPLAALARLHDCLDAWPSSGEPHFLAAGAARLASEFDEAARLLSAAERLGWPEEATRFERACLRGQTGDFPTAEAYLWECVVRGHPDAPLALEVLVPAYLASFQMDRAAECLDRWGELEPGRADVWARRGQVAEKTRSRGKAIEAYTKAVAADPADDESRLALARLTLDDRRPADALPHLEELRRRSDRPAVRLLLARCLIDLNRGSEALPLLEALAREQPQNGAVFGEWGRLELEAGHPAEAVRRLREAADRRPVEPAVLYNLARALELAGDAAGAASAREAFRSADADLSRLADLTRSISSHPADPELRQEAGVILLRNGHEREGLRWLESALAINHDHGPTHRALARYYTGKDPIRAARHKALADRAGTP
jgi:predicted Zn-dependent protease